MLLGKSTVIFYVMGTLLVRILKKAIPTHDTSKGNKNTKQKVLLENLYNDPILYCG